jgi:hypothetical protein
MWISRHPGVQWDVNYQQYGLAGSRAVDKVVLGALALLWLYTSEHGRNNFGPGCGDKGLLAPNNKSFILSVKYTLRDEEA